jgi:hypothetical protein
MLLPIKLIIITKTIQTSPRLLAVLATSKVRKPPSSEKIGKTGTGTATEGIRRETGTLFSIVAAWTLSTKRAQEVGGANDEAIFFCLSGS